MDPRLALTVLCSGAELFAFGRLVRAGVHRVLPWFTIYLAAGFAQSFIWLAGPPRSHAYANAYGLTAPLIIGLQILVFLELWRKLILRYPGADRAVKALGVAIVGASIALGLLGGVDGLALQVGLSHVLLFRWMSWVIRYSATVLCIASSLLAVWASIFEAKLPRYLTRHAYLLACYFGSIAAGYLLMNLDLLRPVHVGEITVGCAATLYILWGILTNGYRDGDPQESGKPDETDGSVGWKQVA
jgi:hypothetical protein